MMRIVNSAELDTSPDFAPIRDVANYWQRQTLDDVHSQMVESATHAVTSVGGREVRLQTHTLEPRTEEVNDDLWVVRFSEHQQPYQEVQHIGAAVTRDAIVPESRVLMFTNNSFKTTAHDMASVRGQKKKDVLEHMAFERAQVAHKLGIKSVIATGYSLGGISAVYFGREAANLGIEVVHINADEPPTKFDRTAGELQKDFLKSGGFGAQRQAMKEAGIPALDTLQRMHRLGLDYAAFGVASLLAHNKRLQTAMSDNILTALARLSLETPDTTVKVGHIVDSRLVEPLTVASFADVVKYGGGAFHGHTSVNNPFIQAFMVADGLRKRP